MGAEWVEWGGLFLICLFFLLMMSPVETGLPHARLSPQTQPAAHFPMQLSTIKKERAQPHSHTHTHTQAEAHTYAQTQEVEQQCQHPL